MGSYSSSVWAMLAAFLRWKLHSDDVSSDVNDVKFLYYPSSNTPIEILFNNSESLESALLKHGVSTVFVIGGFLSNASTPMTIRIRDSYTNFLGDTVNLIVVDWGRLSGSGLGFGDLVKLGTAFNQACQNIGPVGARVAEFIAFLHDNQGTDFGTVSIIGHSLGAHIAGAAGQTLQTNYDAVLSWIVGLDPAGPYTSTTARKLSKGDAAFVAIYHTNAGTLGDLEDLGDLNVYVNGGASQPNCTTGDISPLGVCSHSYSWQIFSAAFNNSIVACRCLTSVTCKCAQCPCVSGSVTQIGPEIDKT